MYNVDSSAWECSPIRSSVFLSNGAVSRRNAGALPDEFPRGAWELYKLNASIVLCGGGVGRV